MGKGAVFPKDTKSTSHEVKQSRSDMLWAFQTKNEYTERMKFLQLIREGNTTQLKNAIEASPNPKMLLSVQDGYGLSALHITARFDRPDAAEFLLQLGADPNVYSNDRNTPLAAACRFQSENVVKLLIKYGANPLLNVGREGTPLHTIALHSTVKIAEIVYKNIKPPVNAMAFLGFTPLHNAAKSGNEDICEWLLKRGADPKARCTRMSTPLMLACKQGHLNIMRRMFHADKVNLSNRFCVLHEVDDEGMGPLHYAVQENRVEAARQLLEWGIDPNTKDVYAMTPLHVCAVDGSVKMVTLLAKFNANLDLRDMKGKTPLHKAVDHRKIDVISALLKEGADIDAQDINCNTPIVAACRKGDFNAVKLLLEHGADISKRSFFGQTCLHVTTIAGNMDILHFLLTHCDKKLLDGIDIFDQTVLHHAARLTDIRFIDELLLRGCSPDAMNAMSETPLHIAARHGSYETVKKLAEVVSDINAQNFESKSAFFCACETGNSETFRALIEAGANVKDTDVHFRDALMVAAMSGFTDIVLDLIELGVQLNTRDEERNTALHHACDHGHVSTVKVLLESHAPVTATNVRGKSPLDLAIDKSKTDVVLLMIEHSSWEDSLSVRDKFGASCMDRMIANIPIAVKAVLDKCVKVSSHDPTDEDYTIEFNYKYIDPGPMDAMSKRTNYNAINSMLSYEREDLLSHPLCQSLLSYKWRIYGRYAFTADITVQLAFLVLLSMYFWVMVKPNETDYRCDAVAGNNDTNLTMMVDGRPVFRYTYMYPMHYAMCGVAIALFIREVKGAFMEGCRYVFSGPFVMTTLSMILIASAMYPLGLEPCENQWRTFAYSTLIFLIRESIMLQRFDLLGLYFTMFFEVFKTMLKIFILLLFFVIALNVPLSIMLMQDGFRDIYQSILSTLAMTIGELNFRDNFIRGNNSPFTYDLYVLFPLFCILMNLSLMNLMIGVAVGDITKVEKRAYLTRLKTQVRYLFGAEMYPFMRIRLWLHTQKVVVMPNKKPRSKWDQMKKTVLYGNQINFVTKKVSKHSQEDTTLDLQKEMVSQRKKIDELTDMTTTVLEMLDKLTKAQDHSNA